MYTDTFYNVESYRYDKIRKNFVVTWGDGSVTYEPKNHPDFVLPDDVKALASFVLSHRIILSPDAEIDGLSPQRIVKEGINATPYRRKR